MKYGIEWQLYGTTIVEADSKSHAEAEFDNKAFRDFVDDTEYYEQKAYLIEGDDE